MSEGVGGEIERLCRRRSGGHGGLLLQSVGAGAVAQAGAAGERGARSGGGRRVAGSPGPAARGRKLIAGVIIPGGGLKKKTLSMSLNKYQY